MLIMAKTKKRVTYADEVDSSEEPPEDLEALIKEARGEDEEETEDTSVDMEVSVLCNIFYNIIVPQLAFTTIRW